MLWPWWRRISGAQRSGPVKTLNEVYSALSTRRRYEVWFVRLGLADGSGAWWFRYLLTNPGRPGCVADAKTPDSNLQPVQVWATWFPRNERPQTFIQGFPLDALDVSARGISPFHFSVADNRIAERSCEGKLESGGHNIEWELQYRSTFRTTMSDKGWIGFSRTPHSNAMFSGHIALDGRVFQGMPLGSGLQGHNCGYRHRSFWTWAHLYFVRADGSASTVEALTYEMPFGLRFRKAVLWHEGKKRIFRKLHETRRDRQDMAWEFDCSDGDGFHLQVAIDGSGPGKHCLPYVKTDCSGTFEVSNNSLASARISLERPNSPAETFHTISGAVLEMVG
jgi:hypothetical protein